MLGFGLTVTVIGMGITFATLFFLIFVINGISAVTKVIDGRSQAEAAGKKSEAAVAQQTPAATAALLQEDAGDIVAAITAAVAYLSQGTMTIKTITRITGKNTPLWSAAGRQETMDLRQI